HRPLLDLGIYAARRTRDIRRRRGRRPDAHLPLYQTPSTGLTRTVRAPRQRPRRLHSRQDRTVTAPRPAYEREQAVPGNASRLDEAPYRVGGLLQFEIGRAHV